MVEEQKIKYGKIAVIRIRGSIKLRKEVKDTLDMLRLYKQNYCVILEATPSIMGMIKKAQSYVSWGEIDPETEKLLIEKRGEKSKDKKGKEITKSFFRLHPPIKGFERKGIKIPFKLGGALGPRGNKIKDLIKKMV